jgi:hypothetical protein
MNIYIQDVDCTIDKKQLFILVRPFFYQAKIGNYFEELNKWNIDNVNFKFVDDISLATIVLIPLAIKQYSKKELSLINLQCQELSIKAFGFVSGDFGIAYPEYSNIIYFRLGGFKSQLSNQNKGFPVALSDHFQLLFKKSDISPRPKNELPTIGFCGHASFSKVKRIKELLIFGKENIKRLLKNPLRKDLEPFFASSYQRAKILQVFEKSTNCINNFIFRNQYRAGTKNRNQTTLEYYNNILNSDYIVCIRGVGNFSVRFYETLMMGRIPIFVNTDCLLPFEEKIDWKKHFVWVEWEDRNNIVAIVSDFHNKLSDEDFKNLQLSNRKLWKETLSVNGILNILNDGI